MSPVSVWITFVYFFFQYEQQERKRREAKEASSHRRKEAASSLSAVSDAAAKVDRLELRREIWIHPLDGRRTRRTTSTGANGASDSNGQNSDDEELAQLPSIEVCVCTFVLCVFLLKFLHVISG